MSFIALTRNAARQGRRALSSRMERIDHYGKQFADQTGASPLQAFKFGEQMANEDERKLTDIPEHIQRKHFDDIVDRESSDERYGKRYLLQTGTKVPMVAMGRMAVTTALGYLGLAADAIALATIEVNIADIAPGQTLVCSWRGKPIFVTRRTPEMIAAAEADDSAELRDPQTTAERCVNKQWMVQVAVCTHLGCVPLIGAGNWGHVGGLFCPCHGSHYDGAGRIRIGPAPLNLEVPKYSFPDENTLLIG
ncbi:MAG: hypothetical protein MHM6MM_004140 [Cercozoa sp. M6MM]